MVKLTFIVSLLADSRCRTLAMFQTAEWALQLYFKQSPFQIQDFVNNW